MAFGGGTSTDGRANREREGVDLTCYHEVVPIEPGFYVVYSFSMLCIGTV